MFRTLLFPLLSGCLVHLPVGLIRCSVKGFLEAFLSSANRVDLFVSCIPSQFRESTGIGIWNTLSQKRRVEIPTSFVWPLQGIVSCISRHTQKGVILSSLLRVRRLRALVFRRIAKDYTGGTRQERVYLSNLFYSVNIARGTESIPTRHTGVVGGPNPVCLPISVTFDIASSSNIPVFDASDTRAAADPRFPIHLLTASSTEHTRSFLEFIHEALSPTLTAAAPSLFKLAPPRKSFFFKTLICVVYNMV
mmetsp:Transcript_18585/g.30934  ORF Transcript_18585/g.30934 Transcript_18585/m.30934 type:complete len:249 (-) Transcript_18585:681-1427(-)